MNKPNIIFFFTDQQRWDTVGCYGQKLNVTPNLDRMAQEGTKFEYAITCQPVCGPARSCLQTGLYATETGCYRNNIVMPLDSKTIANYFNQSGYQTAYVGKWHLASNGGYSNEDIGPEINYKTIGIPEEYRGGYKDYWMASDLLEFTSEGYGGFVFDENNKKVEFKGYRPDCLTDYALDFIRNRDNQRPFFMMISYLEPHHQNNHHRYEGPVNSKERFSNYEIPGDLVDTKGDWRENYPDYLGCCEALDYNLGRLRIELERMGIADNTVVLFTSDHGSHFKTRNKEYKRSCHDACVRVPMVAWGPGFEGGNSIKEMASLIDVPPTLLTAAGICVPEQMKGKPLQQLVMGETKDWPKEAFIQISESQVGRAIRTNKWKYSILAPHKNGSLDSHSDVYIEDFLYDLENDPSEKNNLVKDPAYVAIREELAERIKCRMGQAGEMIPEIRENTGEISSYHYEGDEKIYI